MVRAIRLSTVRHLPSPQPPNQLRWTDAQKKAWACWQEWMRRQPASPDPNARLPIMRFSESPLEIQKPLLETLSSACRCLILEIWPQEQHLFGRLDEIVRGVFAASDVREVRALVMGEKLVRYERSVNSIGQVTRVKSIIPAMAKGRDTDQIQLARAQVRQRWSRRASYLSLPEYLRKMRKVKGLSCQEVIEQLGSHIDLPKYFTAAFLEELELAIAVPIRFDILRGLAHIYGEDLRHLVVASNLTLHGDVGPLYWTTESYPAYIETDFDAVRFMVCHAHPKEYFSSLGHFLLLGMKDPLAYGNITGFAKSIGVGDSVLNPLLNNEHPPDSPLIIGIAESLRDSVASLMEVIVSQFYDRSLFAPLFPDRWIWIDGRSREPDQIADLLKKPSVGGFAMAGRKITHPFSSATKLGKLWRGNGKYLSDREYGKCPVTRYNLSEWIDAYRRLGLPEELLQILVMDNGISHDETAYLIGKALEGKSLSSLKKGKERMGKRQVATLLHETSAEPATLLAAQRLLPQLNMPQVYRRFHPDIGEFIPEAVGPNPFLDFTEEDVRTALFEFDLGAEIVAFRLNPPQRYQNLATSDGVLTLDAAGEILGITKYAFTYYEQEFVLTRERDRLKNFSQALGRPARLIYLAQHPEILCFHPVAHYLDANRNKLPYSQDRYQGLMREVKKRQKQDERDSRGIKNMGKSSLRRGVLAYFLGRRSDGTIDFSLPKGETWKSFSRRDFEGEMRTLVADGSFTPEQRHKVYDSLRNKVIILNSLVSLARLTKLPQRDLFMLAYRDALATKLREAHP